MQCVIWTNRWFNKQGNYRICQ